jgi:hypothetical protein
MKRHSIAFFIGLVTTLTACETKTTSPQTGIKTTQLHTQAKRAFRTMSLTECDCLSQSYFGQVMKDNHGYTIGGGYGSIDNDNILATTAKVNNAIDMVLDASDNIYFVEYDTHRVRIIPKSSGTYFGQSMIANYIYTIGGTGMSGTPSDGTDATSANLTSPHSIKLDSYGNVLIVANNRVLIIPKTTGTYYGVSAAANKIYTVVGTGTHWTFSNGTAATSADFMGISDIALDSNNNIAISEYNNHGIDFVPASNGTYYGISMTANCAYHIVGTGGGGSAPYGDGGICTSGSVGNPMGLAFDSTNNLFISDCYHDRVRMVPKSNGTYFGQSMTANYIYTVAGNDIQTYAGDGNLATTLPVAPSRLTTDADDNLYIADEMNVRVRMIPRTNSTHFSQSMAAGNIYSIMGRGGAYMDGANALSVGLRPIGIAIDSAKNLVVSGPGYVGMVPVCNQ